MKRSTEKVVKNLNRKFSPRDSLKSNSALGSIRSTDSMKGVLKTKKSCDKMQGSKKSSISKMTFLKKRAS